MGLPLPLLNIRRRLAGGISPAALFLNSEPGVWYDPSDLTTMFQDRAGTTPVTATGQTVGLVLDKRLGLTPGPELVTNGDFSNGTTGWTNLSGVTSSVVSGEAIVTVGTGGRGIQQGLSGVFVAGRTYKVTADIRVVSGSGSVRVAATNSSYAVAAGSVTVSGATAQTVSFIVTAASDTDRVLLSVSTSGETGGFDNVSVREIPGNHMVATADASRGTYGIEPFGGRRNLLTFTEQFDNAAWVKGGGGTGVAPLVTSNSVVAPDGTTTADTVVFNKGAGTTTADISTVSQAVPASVQITHSIWVRADAPVTLVLRNPRNNGTYLRLDVTTDWQRVSVTDPNAPAASSNFEIGLRGGVGVVVPNTATVYIWGAQLELGSTATPYQRVTTAFDVTEAGVPTVHYVQFDGADDGYLTSTITPGTDKVQVFAGVRKLSDATLGAIVEHSTNSATSDGALALLASAASNPNYVFRSRGTTSTDATAPSSYVAPITNVITGLGDISGDRSTIRVNGSQVAQNVNDQGTGNYLAYPLYIGRRGGSSLPFNGRLYQLVARFGPNLDTARIQQVERYMAQKTGVTL